MSWRRAGPGPNKGARILAWSAWLSLGFGCATTDGPEPGGPRIHTEASATKTVPPYLAALACPAGPDGKSARLQPADRPGSLPKEHIRGRIREVAGPQLRSCYRAALRRVPIDGRVRVHFRIAANGRVEQACVLDSAMEDPKLESCALAVFRGLQFNRPTGGGSVLVTYPLVFRDNSGVSAE